MTLQRLLSFGQRDAEHRPSLVEYARRDYEPVSTDSEFLTCWAKLRNAIEGEDIPDAALTGLRAFLTQVAPEDSATVCLTLNCDVSFDVSAGMLCMDDHMTDLVCCDAHCMLSELDTLIEAYDARFA
ncbi:MAG: hypothetical protein GYB64_14245 [Chloroflexi bacterium]|nr:hypothetical protein [Chloroflexota bacterium]